MPNWSSNQWFTQWPLFLPGTGISAPSLALASPLNGSINVSRFAPLRIAAFTVFGPPTATFTVNGVTVATSDGSTLTCNPGWMGFNYTVTTRTFLEIAPYNGYAPGQVVNVAVAVADYLSNTTRAGWSFTVEGTTDYAGNNLLTEEGWILQPMQQFLELEPLRMLLLQKILVDESFSLSNRDNIAARALYQLAYECELSSVLNSFMSPNDVALSSSIPSKRKTFDLDALLQNYQGRIDAGVSQLFSSGALPVEYRNLFVDQQGSLLYNYRVNAVAVLLFLARAVEVAAITPTK